MYSIALFINRLSQWFYYYVLFNITILFITNSNNRLLSNAHTTEAIVQL